MVMRGINMIVVHCTDSAWGEVEEIRRWHRTRGFEDIGYHYLICNRFPYYKNLKDGRSDPLFDGKVQKGRDEKYPGAHVAGKNGNSIGISLVGIDRFTSAQFESLKYLVKGLMDKYMLPVADVCGHYELDRSKSCPNFGMDGFRRELGDYVKSPKHWREHVGKIKIP